MSPRRKGAFWKVRQDLTGELALALKPTESSARRFTNFNQQYIVNGKATRLAIVGIDFPADTGSCIPLIAGRNFQAQHYEVIADRSSGLELDDVIRLRNNDFRVVGLSRGQVDVSGDSMLFLTVPDA